MYRSTEFLDMDDFNPNLVEDLQAIGLISKKNKLTEDDNLSHMAKLRNPFDDMHSDEEDEQEETPEDQDTSDEEGSDENSDQEGDMDSDGSEAENHEQGEDEDSQDMSGQDENYVPGSNDEESYDQEAMEDKKKKQLELARGMSTGAGKVAPLSPLRMGESKSIKKANALLNEVKTLVSRTNDTQRKDAVKAFAQVSRLSENLSRCFLNLSKSLGEENLRGVAKTYRILASDSGKMAFAIHEGKSISRLDESFKNQLGLLLQGVDLFEDIREACSSDMYEDDMEDKEENEGHDEGHDGDVHVDIVKGSHDFKHHDYDDDDDDKKSKKDDEEMDEENLY